jgi:dinuclear metal center YbgI/SA1388 family protein
MKTRALIDALNELLTPEKYKDYCPNGLQVEGNPVTKRVVCGVSATQALIEYAVASGAQTVLVHHGYFWKGEAPNVVGLKKNRLKMLLENDLNLIAYHLPLDGNELLGNNAEFARLLGISESSSLAEEPLVRMGELAAGQTVSELAKRIGSALGRTPFVVGDPAHEVRKVAWCSGAAQDFLETAARAGAEAYISGEISERTYPESLELGVPYLSVGHHASETLGISALSRWVAARFPELDVEFVDLANPV